MGLFDRFKKNEAAPVSAPAPAAEPKKKEPKICLDEEVLMEGILVRTDLSEEEEDALYDTLEALQENWDEEPEGNFEKLLEMAKGGFVPAMYWVADRYETGSGVEQDDEEYHRWVWRNMYAGDSSGYTGAAECYLYGDEIIPQDVVKAFSLYLEANRLDEDEGLAKERIDEIIGSITDGTFESMYGGTAQEAMEIAGLYKQSI